LKGVLLDCVILEYIYFIVGLGYVLFWLFDL